MDQKSDSTESLFIGGKDEELKIHSFTPLATPFRYSHQLLISITALSRHSYQDKMLTKLTISFLAQKKKKNHEKLE